MFDDAFANLEGQVQSAERRVAELEILNNAQGMQVVVEEEAMRLA